PWRASTAMKRKATSMLDNLFKTSPSNAVRDNEEADDDNSHTRSAPGSPRFPGSPRNASRMIPAPICTGRRLGTPRSPAPPSGSPILATQMTNSERKSVRAVNNRIIQNNLQSITHFNIPKLHALVHFDQQIRMFGSLPQHSTEIGESSHKKQLKDGYNHSNKNDYVKQLLAQYNRIHAFAMRVMNLEALAK